MYKHLTRKVRKVGGSLVVTIPMQLAVVNDLKAGDVVEIIPVQCGEIRIVKSE